jgi:hypothetical protein
MSCRFGSGIATTSFRKKALCQLATCTMSPARESNHNSKQAFKITALKIKAKATSRAQDKA